MQEIVHDSEEEEEELLGRAVAEGVLTEQELN